MKILGALLLSAIVCMMFAACGSTTDKYYKNISEIRDGVYEGASQTMRVEVVSGVREQPFVIDGTAGEKTDFTVITVTPAQFVPNRMYTYSVTVGEKAYTGVMTMHPFGETYSVELNVRATEPVLNVSLKLDAYEETIEVKSVVQEGDIDASYALQVAMKALDAELQPLKKNGGLDCEIYVRIIANPINSDGGYYWYVAFMGADTYAALIDMKTAQVVGVKN